MTYQPSPYPPQQPVVPTGFITPAPRPRRSRTPLIVAAIAAVLVLGALVAAILIVGLPGGGISKAAAERACRTAVGDEWQQRVKVAGAGSTTTVIPSVQKIEMLETYEVDGGYAVNATVHYTLTTGIIAPVEGTIDLTCTATGSDDAPETSVENR